MLRLAGLLLLALLSGCQLGYYGQAIGGHWSLMAKREPLDKVLDDPHTSDRLASQLRLSRRVLAFAGQQLELPADHVYHQYVALDRDAVVWNVLAAPRFSLTPKTWCYPLLGCVSYRGYFHREAAERQARVLADKGLDSYVSGAIAYSTLGWFDDPL
ncbi:MAG: aminopeptidase, partial [Alcanivorax sp.]|nr:aminopeptidase [Alcanivorax sp.]